MNWCRLNYESKGRRIGNEDFQWMNDILLDVAFGMNAVYRFREFMHNQLSNYHILSNQHMCSAESYKWPFWIHNDPIDEKITIGQAKRPVIVAIISTWFQQLKALHGE